MQIPAPTPKVIPASEEKVYDKLWINKLTADFSNPNGDGYVTCEYTPYRILGDGVTKELAPGGPRYKSVENVFALSETDPQVATAIAALLTAVAPYLE